MEIADICITNPLDIIYVEQMREAYERQLRSGKGPVIRIGMEMGGDRLFPVVTTGEEEFVLFNVFVAKIRRENEGLEQKTRTQQHAWYDLASMFTRDFGSRTPPDIVECRNNLGAHLGL